ncbi:lipocalin family protein [Porticoccaceae bacterium]|nr:lipocalin family protein [Porticoccaceae bacterium]
MKLSPNMLIASLLLLAGCSSHQPMATVDQVDIERFMGDWYVIANIPTFLEKDAYNPIESYRLDADGTIATTFTFNAGALDGEQKIYQPRGFVSDSNNAVWGMQFIWPIKADYRIVYLDEEYQYTVIGRNSRDYVWIMARSTQITEQKYLELEGFVGSLGYDLSQLQRASHRD